MTDARGRVQKLYHDLLYYRDIGQDSVPIDTLIDWAISVLDNEEGGAL